MRPRNDPAVYFFGLAALACLLVSLPATLAAMQLFHGDRFGVAATLVFEIGAVGSELATLAIPQWRGRLLTLTIVLLLLTTGGNYALGIDHFSTAAIDRDSTYAGIRASGYGPLVAMMSSAIFPALLLVFLTAFTARWRMVSAAPLAVEPPTIVHNTQINVGVLPRTYAEFTAARAKELPGATDAEIAAALESTPATVRKLLDRVTIAQQES